MREMIKMLLGEKRTDADTVVSLMVLGLLTVGENGLTTCKPGVYKLKENIPADDR